MSEYIEFKISDDILRALRLRGAPSSEGERLCFEAADEYEKGNYETAVKLWRTSAELNDGYAQLCLAACLRAGRGIERDECASFGMLNKSASQGNPAAQYFLAQCYEFGDGADKNMTEAFGWYQKSAENDFADAQYRLGRIYSSHKYLPVSEAKAV